MFLASAILCYLYKLLKKVSHFLIAGFSGLPAHVKTIDSITFKPKA